MNKNYQLIQTRWQQHAKELAQIRHQVFINEQQVPEALEWDEFDKDALHILVMDKKQTAIATGRIKNDGQIGRMAVIKSHRRQAIGSAILEHLIDYAKQQSYPDIYLHAQISAIEFYRKFGFTEYGKQFMDAGIAHISMKL